MCVYCFGHSLGSLPNSVWFYEKKGRQNKHYLKIIVLVAVPGGMARGDGGLTSKDRKSNTAMSKWLPQANFPFGTPSDTSS